jgi:aminotransferase EvaB
MPIETVPLNDLKRQIESLSVELHAAVDRVLRSGYFVLGPEVEAFEREFAEYCGTSFCVAVANGTDALELALRAVGVGQGDAVATVANAGGYSSAAIRAVGGLPLYVEIADDRLTMSAPALSAVLLPNVRAVIVTHLYGQIAGMPGLLSAANGLGIPVIEDCAQAHGAELGGRRAGNWGAIGCFSFYPTKNLGALGDAGAVVTNDAELAKSVRLFRQYGWRSKYHSAVAGGRNSRLDELQAALLRAKLPHLDGWNARRRAIAAALNQGLAGLGLRLPCSLGLDYIAHLYVIRSEQREALRTALMALGVTTAVHYPVADHLQESSQGLGHSRGYRPISEAACDQVLTLPCFPELRDDEIERVIAATAAATAALHGAATSQGASE